MKILHLVNEFDNVGNGIVNVCCDLSCEQAKLGHEVLVLSKEGEFSNLIELNGGNFRVLNQERNIFNILSMFKKMDNYLNKFNPDIINCHMMTGLILAKFFQKKYNYKIVSTVHNVYQKSSFLMKYSDALVCLSPAILDFFKNRGVPDRKLFVIENGVIGSPRRLSLDNINPVTLEKPSIVSVGAVCFRKGTDILIKALKILHNKNIKVHLYLIGNLDWPELETEVHNLQLSEYVHFQGLDKQPQRYLLNADVYVLASRRETFPLSILEAKECGLPIIAAEIDGCPDALDHGESGLLFKTEDEHDLADKISQMLSDKDLNTFMRNKSINSSSKFTVTNMAENYLKLYAKLIRVTKE